jgi:hypothetical protein
VKIAATELSQSRTRSPRASDRIGLVLELVALELDVVGHRLGAWCPRVATVAG